MDLSVLQFMFDPTVFLSGLIFFLVGWYILQEHRSARYPPGPRPWPIVGSVPYIASSNKYLFETLHDLHLRHGDIIRLKLGPTVNFVCIRGREKIHKAFVQMNEIFKYRPRAFFVLNFIFGEKGVFFGNGDAHTSLRKFTLGALREFGVGRKGIEERIHEEASLMVETMVKEKGKPRDYRILFKKSVNNIIANIVYGTRFEYDDPQSQQLIDDIDFVFKTLSIGLPENYFPVLRFLPGSKLMKVFEVFKKLEAYAKSRIKEHRETFDPDNIRDFVDIFLQNEGSHDKSLNDPDETAQNVKFDLKFTQSAILYSGVLVHSSENSTTGNKIQTWKIVLPNTKEDNLFRVIVDLFNAGTDTTATTFIWTIAHLLRQPEIQDKCRQEILQVVGPSRMICLQDKQNLPYLNALMNETLRFCTIAPISAPHTVLQDTEFEGYIIPKNSIIVGHLSDLLYNKDVWGDPENFRPERFLSQSGKMLETSEDFSPFSIGGRSCLGKQLAKMELFIFLGTLIQRFEFKVPEGQGLPSVKRIQTGITSQPEAFEVCAIPLDV